ETFEDARRGATGELSVLQVLLDLCHGTVRERAEQIIAGGEIAVQGSHADPRFSSDHRHRDVVSVPVQADRSGRQQGLPVARRIGTSWPRSIGGQGGCSGSACSQPIITFLSRIHPPAGHGGTTTLGGSP